MGQRYGKFIRIKKLFTIPTLGEKRITQTRQQAVRANDNSPIQKQLIGLSTN